MLQRIYFHLALLVVGLSTGCSTTESLPQGKLPPTNAQSPRYQTDEVLRDKIAQLKEQLSISPDDGQIRLELASLYFELEEYEAALPYLEQLKEEGFTNDPRIYGTLGQIYRGQEKFAEARENYQIFLSLVPESSDISQKIREEIAELTFIIQSLASPYEINARSLNSPINTKNSEYLPQFTMDDSIIIFTRRFFNQEDLFTATLTEGGYQTEAIDEINTRANEGAHTLSADGQLLIFTQCYPKQGFGGCDLYRSKKLPSGKWSKPANMGQRINSRSWDSQPSLSADGRTLYFASKRSGGLGGSDIYVSKKLRDGTWSPPLNLGASVNTKKNDESPFIHADGRTLYFRSKGYIGHGDYDLYKTVKTGNNWGAVINMGYPINSTGEDGALVVSLDGTRGYYATDKFNGEQLEHLDLFEFNMPEKLRPRPMTFLKGRVTDNASKLPLQANIRIASLDNQEHRAQYTANYNGEFLAAIPLGEPILINIDAEGHVFYSDHYFYEEVKYGVDPHHLDIALMKPEPLGSKEESAPIILNNIFFASGSATLLPASDSEILILYGLLLDQPEMRIRILGHTDNVGSKEDNQRLSEQRANAVRQALIEKGISPSRIESVGMGELGPIDSNETEEGRSNNRRTEFVIL